MLLATTLTACGDAQDHRAAVSSAGSWHVAVPLGRELAADLGAAPVRTTSILTGDAPMIRLDRQEVLFWSSAEQILDFSAKNDVARATASAALDADGPRVVEVAGSRPSATCSRPTSPGGPPGHRGPERGAGFGTNPARTTPRSATARGATLRA